MVDKPESMYLQKILHKFLFSINLLRLNLQGVPNWYLKFEEIISYQIYVKE